MWKGSPAQTPKTEGNVATGRELATDLDELSLAGFALCC